MSDEDEREAEKRNAETLYRLMSKAAMLWDWLEEQGIDKYEAMAVFQMVTNELFPDPRKAGHKPPTT